MKSNFKRMKRFTILGLAAGYYALSKYCKNKCDNIQDENLESTETDYVENENRAGN